jgi:PqqD family protein of HPr-rel-A system
MAGPRFIADPADQLKAVRLDGLTAVFHRPSGITHLLAPPAPQILEALAGSAADVEGLLARIAEQFEVEGGADALTARLAELEAAGLVRRA